MNEERTKKSDTSDDLQTIAAALYLIAFVLLAGLVSALVLRW